MKVISNYPFIFLILTGCCHGSPVVRPVEVRVPVAVSCELADVPEPAWNVLRLPATASDEDKLKAELADLELSRGYIEVLEAELAACS